MAYSNEIWFGRLMDKAYVKMGFWFCTPTPIITRCFDRVVFSLSPFNYVTNTILGVIFGLEMSRSRPTKRKVIKLILKIFGKIRLGRNESSLKRSDQPTTFSKHPKETEREEPQTKKERKKERRRRRRNSYRHPWRVFRDPISPSADRALLV